MRAVISLMIQVLSIFTACVSMAAPLELNGNDPVRELGPYSSRYADPVGELTAEDAFSLYSKAGFEALQTPHFDAGYSITPHWIALPVTNRSGRSAIYQLSSNIPYVPALSIALVRSDGSIETLLDKGPKTPWLSEQFLGQSVVAAPFNLESNEVATLLARFEPYGIGVLPLSLETERTASDQATQGRLIAGPFYSFALTSLALLFMFVLAMRHPGGLNFLFLFGVALVMMAQLDGYLNQWVWPDYPQWNKVASFPMLLLICSAGFKTASFMLSTGEAKRLAHLSRSLSYVSFLPFFAVPWVEVPWLILVGFVFMGLAMALLTYAIIDWAKLLRAKTWFAIGIGCTLFLAIGLILGNVLSGEGNLSAHNLILTKALYMLITVIIMASYATHVASLNREHEIAVQRELELARNEARISADLLASERRYAHAQNLVTHHRNRLANASHDLRQPIASLRLTLDSLARSGDENTKDAVSRSFDYLDELVRSHLDEEREFDLDKEIPADIETLRVSLITETVAEMFKDEAAAKGLRLRHYERDAMIHVPPIPVMRIVSNLVSNAVKHTQNGGVLIGARMLDGKVAIDVCDTGLGLTKVEMEAMRCRFKKGPLSTGEGLGLAICYELAALHGFAIETTSKPNKGSRFRLMLPEGAVRGIVRGRTPSQAF